MELIFNGVKQAFILIFIGNKEIWEIVLLTIRVSGMATVISMFLGMPLGFFVGLNQFPAKKILVSLLILVWVYPQ